MSKKLILERCKLLPSLIFSRNIQFEPPYLDERKTSVPCYPPLNIQVRGYDYTVIERYAKWVHNTATHMDIEVLDSWATPGEKTKVSNYKKNSSIVQSSFDLQLYERNVQIDELPSTTASVFLEVLKAAVPEGVELSVHEHMQEHYDIRKIPDLMLKELKAQLDEVGRPKKK